MRYLILFSFLLCSSLLYAENDTLFFENDIVLIGEIKSMDRGLITLETDFSDSDFKIEFDKVERISTERDFFLTLKNGERVMGKFVHNTMVDTITIATHVDTLILHVLDITEMRTFDKRFIDRLGAYIDFGLSATKANNFKQYSLRSGLNYTAATWKIFVNANSIRSEQDSVPSTKRSDGDAGFNYFLPHNWYLIAKYDFLTNDEQNLKLRGVFSGGLGKYIIRTNAMYFGLVGGVASNNERYITEETPNKNSGEAFYGADFNIYNIGDLDFQFIATGYSGITEKGRFRSDINMNVKYELPMDFYIGFGTTINYDNQPTEGASELDYVIQGTIGWSW